MPLRRPIPSFAAPAIADEPINYLNTTPLIDVMLVLLVMFIVTVPVMNHKVRIDLPGGPVPVVEKPVVHSLEIDQAGRVTLDGAAISLAALPSLLAAIKEGPVSDLTLRTEADTPYEHFDRIWRWSNGPASPAWA